MSYYSEFVELELDFPQFTSCLFLYLNCQILFNFVLQWYWAVLEGEWCSFSYSFYWKTAGIVTWAELLMSIFIHALMSMTRDKEVASLLGFDVNCIFSEVLERRRLFQRIFVLPLISRCLIFNVCRRNKNTTFLNRHGDSKSLNVYIGYQWHFCPIIPGDSRENVIKGSTGNPSEWRNDES